ncbi:hypothetical protein SAMN05414137_120191 [Streptacidiphilus jiangxiensis]|uniref:Uncharacterized protein n=1 Tax=Streptacidiphilus jiangxiensis TaxID=235985 RepID=A0A1H7WKG6_STRJI|nr:hypothetical protein SAMN05414137_120191 [Streptacidiphilus jiangxiensis]
MTIEEERRAARALVSQADSVGRDSGREPLRAVLQWLTRGRLGRRQGPYISPDLGTPWQDTPSHRRGWRWRAVYLEGEPVFEVDYVVCSRCCLGWVEQPATHEPFQRLGLAAAGLTRLRVENPGLSWHTLGGHLVYAVPFWNAIGTGVPGSYQQRELCPHVVRE